MKRWLSVLLLATLLVQPVFAVEEPEGTWLSETEYEFMTWLEEYLPAHKDELATFDEDAYFDAKIAYPEMGINRENWFFNWGEDFTQDDFRAQMLRLYVSDLWRADYDEQCQIHAREEHAHLWADFDPNAFFPYSGVGTDATYYRSEAGQTENAFKQDMFLRWIEDGFFDYVNPPSDWARTDIRNNRDLIPEELQSDYRQPITRGEFGALAVNFLAMRYGYDCISLTSLYRAENTFSDVAGHPWEDELLTAAYFGVLTGYEDATMRPDELITRQEAAAMLWRMYKLYVSWDVDPTAVWYLDAEEIGAWAMPAVLQVTALGLMQGTGDRLFSPNENLTREQAYLMISRLYYDAPVSVNYGAAMSLRSQQEEIEALAGATLLGESEEIALYRDDTGELWIFPATGGRRLLPQELVGEGEIEVYYWQIWFTSDQVRHEVYVDQNNYRTEKSHWYTGTNYDGFLYGI